MRDHAEDDPKKRHPTSARSKGDNPLEAQEYHPYKVGPHGREGERRDHRVQRC
jgi:hypothetical protein